MVKVGRAVAGKALGVGGAVVAVLAMAYIFRKTQAGTAIIQSLKGAGDVAAQSILAPIEGLLKGVAAGSGSIVQESTKIGANLASFSEALQAGDFQSIIDGSYVTKYGAPGNQGVAQKDVQQKPFTSGTVQDERPNDTVSARQNFAPQPVAALDLKQVAATTAQRIRNTVSASKSKNTTAFGGFGSATAQESALQRAIAEARAKYPQYFK